MRKKGVTPGGVRTKVEPEGRRSPVEPKGWIIRFGLFRGGGHPGLGPQLNLGNERPG